jgi:hypothetical protein
MATITIEVSDELSGLIAQAGDRLPELLAKSLQQPALPSHVYRYILDFLASNPSASELADLGPTPEMAERLRTLIRREAAGEISQVEKDELDEYERLEHLMVTIKAGNLRHITGTR